MTDSDGHAHPPVPQYSPELFRGTAEYYSLYRPKYPPVVIDSLLGRLRLKPDDRLLDLACGTGEVAFALKDVFPEIWAVDAEPDMIEGGRKKADELGVTSVTWSVARAEDLDFADDVLGVIAAGRAFHRLNRPLVAARALKWLRTKGYLVDLGIDTSGLSSPSEQWLSVAAEVYQRWLPRAQRQREDRRSEGNADQPQATTEQVLEDAGFLNVEKVAFEVSHMWSVEEFIGYLYSTSYSSKAFWGDACEGFERDLRSTLLELNPSGDFHEMMSAYFTVGQAP